MPDKKKIAILGTNGIPARYGGFETLAEQLTKTLSADYDITVYCSKRHPAGLREYAGAALHKINLDANGWQSLLYDIVTLLHAVRHSDVLLYLGPVAGILLPFFKLSGKKIIVNHGGLNEWERTKYGKAKRWFLKKSFRGSRKMDFNIADNTILQQSLKTNLGIDSIVIRYGGDHVSKAGLTPGLLEKYPFLSSVYYVSVSRAQVDNNLHMILEAFERLPDRKIVLISNWEVSEYGKELKRKYKDKYDNIIILDAVYDQNELNAIRSNACGYIHSHSYCGTAPSLVEAMSLGLPVFSFDVATNRETTCGKAFYFSDAGELVRALESIGHDELSENARLMKDIASSEYTWDRIGRQYSSLF